VKQFKTSKTIRNVQGDNVITMVSSIESVTILTAANTDRGIEQFFTIKSREEAQAVVDVMTTYIQYLAGQTELLP